MEIRGGSACTVLTVDLSIFTVCHRVILIVVDTRICTGRYRVTVILSLQLNYLTVLFCDFRRFYS